MIYQSTIAWLISFTLGAPYGLKLFLIEHNNIIQYILEIIVCVMPMYDNFNCDLSRIENLKNPGRYNAQTKNNKRSDEVGHSNLHGSSSDNDISARTSNYTHHHWI